MIFALPVPGFGTVFRVATVVVGVVAAIPTRTRDLRSRPAPASNYDAAVALASAQQALDDSIAVPQGRSILLTHGHRVPCAVVLLHGFTNSPRQFAELADSLFAAGDNVYVPRLPHHAERGGDVGRLAGVTAEGLRDLADASVDIAAGLGDSITVVGLSAGATVAACIAQNRREVQRAVLIAPAFQVTHVPSFFERALVNLGSRGPNVTRRVATDTAQPDLAPGIATKGVAQVFRLGIAVRRSAEALPPLAGEMVFLLNAKNIARSRPHRPSISRGNGGPTAGTSRCMSFLILFMSRLAHNGDMMFRGENPANGITFTVWSRDSGGAAILAVKRAGAGAEVWRQSIVTRRGATTAMWNLRGPSLPPPPSATGGDEPEGGARPINGAFVPAGTYQVTLTLGDRVVGQGSFAVRPDRRQDAPPAAVSAWHTSLDSIATLYRATSRLAERARSGAGDARARADTVAELQTRIGALHQALEAQVGSPTADMRAQLASFSRMYVRLKRAVAGR